MHACVISHFSSLRLCDSTDCNLLVHGILQARILEWVAMPSSRGSSQPRHSTHISCIGRWVLYHLSHKQSPIWVYPKSNERVLKRKKSRERLETQRGSPCEDRGRNGVMQPQAKGFLEPQKLKEVRSNCFIESSVRALLSDILILDFLSLE